MNNIEKRQNELIADTIRELMIIEKELHDLDLHNISNIYEIKNKIKEIRQSLE